MKKIYKLFSLAVLLCCSISLWAAQSLPYSYGFEDYNLSADGWTKYFGTSITNNNAECAIVGDAKKTGSYGFRFSSAKTKGENAQYLISPELDAANGLDLTFWYKASSNYGTEKFKVGYSTTDADVASFTWGEEYATNNSSSWLKYEGSFPAGTKYVAIYYYANYQYRLYVDDFEFLAKVSGPALQVLDGLTKITSGHNYNFGLATPGTLKMFTMKNPGTESAPIKVTHTGDFTVTPSTQISIPAGEGSVLAIYMPETSGSDVITISSTAEGIDDFIINVSGTVRDDSKFFESLLGGALPEDWTKTGTWYWNTTNGAYNTTYAESNNYRLITPQLTVAEGEQFFVEVQGTYAGYQGFKLEYSADGSTWTSSATVPTITSDWQTLSFNDVPAGKYYIALHGWQVRVRNFYGGSVPSVPKDITLDSKTANSLTLSWTPAGAETAWKLQYSTDGTNWSDEVAVATNPFELTGLSASTLYYVRVRADIVSSEWSKVASFRTECGAVEALPYAENFEGHDVDAAPVCWELLNAQSASTSTYPYIAVKAQSGYYKDAKALFFRTNNGNVGYAIFPTFSFSFAKAQIAFTHKEESGTGKLVLGYLTNIADASTFTALYTCTSSSNWTDEEGISLATVPEGARLAFQHTVSHPSYYYDAAVDNITISLAPSCVKPTGLTISEEAAHSAKVAWTSEASGWDLEYKLSSASEWTAAEFVTNPFTLTGLTANAAYDVRVRNNCGDATSDWIETSFNTPCEDKTLPFSENFEGGVLPGCWLADSRWAINTNAHAGSYCARYSSGGKGDLVLPSITLDDDAMLFYWHASSHPTGLVLVNGTSVQSIATTSGNWKKDSVDLSAYNGQNVVITFTSSYSTYSNRYLYIDDIAVTYKPVAVPTNLVAAQGNTTATITWESAEGTSWNLRYRVVGAEEWITENGLTEKTKVLEGLTNGITYEAQVQAVVSANRQSAWTESVTFTPENCPTVLKISLASATYNSIVVSWTTSGEGTWDLDYRIGENPWTERHGLSEKTLTLEELETGVEYTVQVGPSCGEQYVDTTFTLVYSEPVAAEAENITDESATVQWIGVIDTDTYEYAFVLPGDEAVWTETKALTATATSLAPATDYLFVVRAKYPTGVSGNDTTEFATIKIKPASLAVSNITTNSAKLSWTKEGLTTAFEYAVGNDSTALTWNALAAGTLEYTLSELTANTSYTFYVRTKYSDELKSDSVKVTFRTECGAIVVDAENPWFEGFEDYAAGSTMSPVLPDCWEVLGANSSYPYIYVTSSASYVKTGNRGLYFYSGYDYGYAILPAFETALNTLQITFSHKEYTAGKPAMAFGYLTNIADASTFVAIKELSSATWEEVKDLSLASVPAGARLAFRCGTPGYYYAGIDDITISTLPTCIKPVLAEPVILPDGATLSWTAGNGEDQFQYRVDEDAWTLLEKDVLSVTLHGYVPGVAHTFEVRAYCSSEDQSEAVSTSFTAFCPAPTDPQVTDITTTTATLSWTAAAGIADYQYQLNGGEWTKVTGATSVALEGLTANTAYSVNVRSFFNETVQSANATTSFRTECAVVDAASWGGENFESFNNQEVPACWDVITTGETYPAIYVSSSSSHYHNGNRGLLINNENKKYGLAIFPELTGLNTQQISFWHKEESALATNCGNLEFGYVTDATDSTTFVLLHACDLSGSWVEVKDIRLNTVPDDARLAFRYIGKSSSWEYYTAVDDITLSAIPSCVVPTDLAASAVKATTATLTWTSEAEAFKVQIKAEGEEWGAAQDAATASFNLTELTPNTKYYARVKAVCGLENESEWSAEISFTTDCEAEETPFHEAFEAGIPECWKTTGTWAINEETEYSRSGKSARCDAYSSAGTLTIPSVVIPDNTWLLRFFIRNISSNASFYVPGKVIVTAEGEYPVETAFIESSTLAEQRIALTAFAGKTVKITFSVQKVSSTAKVFIDDVDVTTEDILTALDNTGAEGAKATKRLENDVLIIEFNGVQYNAQGQLLKK